MGSLRIHLPAPLRSTGVTRLRRSYGCSDSCPAALRVNDHEHRLVPDRSHGLLYSNFRTFRRQSPDAPAHRFATLPLSVGRFRFPGLGFAFYPQAHRSTRPNRVRQPADRSFTSGCSPRRLAASQLPWVTGRRAYAWGGLAPPRSSNLSVARVAASTRQPWAMFRYPFGVKNSGFTLHSTDTGNLRLSWWVSASTLDPPNVEFDHATNPADDRDVPPGSADRGVLADLGRR